MSEEPVKEFLVKKDRRWPVYEVRKGKPDLWYAWTRGETPGDAIAACYANLQRGNYPPEMTKPWFTVRLERGDQW